MKKVGVLSVLGVIAMGFALTGWAISLCDFHSPVTYLSDMRLSFGYRYFDDAATAGVDVNSGRVTLDYDQLFDSPDFGFTMFGSAELAIDGFVAIGWLGHGAGTFRYYLMEDMPLFAFGGLEASLATGQPQPGVDVLVGMGYGRFTDVTPLAKAMTIEGELLDLKALVGPLTDETLMEIAGVIGSEIEYDTLKDLVADVEALIEAESGAQLDARALLTIEEVILAVGDSRKCGWAVQGGIGYELVDPFGGARTIVVSISGDAAYANGPKDQLLFHASFTGPFDLFNENTLSATATYEYALGEDSTFYADYTLQRVQPLGLAASTSHAAGLSIGFDVGGADVTLQVSLTRDAGDPGWSVDISLAAAMDLL
ncbi:hypothetical protein KJ567_00710 [Candidatus Bipolaricaulota bacterium]|nr:hypothetical protein [Candidatus Bipolaricaulota bacterium]